MSRLLGLLWNVNAAKGRRTDRRETAERRHQRRMHLQLNFHAISPYAFVMQRNFILIVFALLSDDQHGEWCMKRIYHQQQRHVWWWERIFDWKDHIVHSVRRDVEENVHKSFIVVAYVALPYFEHSREFIIQFFGSSIHSGLLPYCASLYFFHRQTQQQLLSLLMRPIRWAKNAREFHIHVETSEALR